MRDSVTSPICVSVPIPGGPLLYDRDTCVPPTPLSTLTVWHPRMGIWPAVPSTLKTSLKCVFHTWWE